MKRWLERLSLGRPELVAWALYDWANSAAMTVVVTAVFPIYFSQVAAAELGRELATQRFALATTISLGAIALAAPLLGALADVSGAKKRLLGVFLVLGVAAVAGLFGVGPGDWVLALVLFGLANVGLSGSFVFYDALLPHVARPEELDRVSTSAYALGYLGGGILLALNLAWIQRPDLFGLPSGEGLSPESATLPTRLAFLSVAVWWGLFALPLLRRVPEPPAAGPPGASAAQALAAALRRLASTLRELRRYRHAALLLVAFLLYNDGILTIIRLAAVYAEEKGLGRGTLIAAILMVQLVGVPFAFLFGALARRIGPKRAIFLGLAVYLLVTLRAFWLETAADFWMLALGVAAVQGGCQALSRSLFASMIPASHSGEFFGLFAVLEKFAGFAGPAVFLAVRGASGSSELGVLAIAGFFLTGGALLAWVDVEAGRRAVAGAGSPADDARGA